MKNKKLAILALALSLIGTVGFAACGDKGGDKGGEGNGNSNSSSDGGNIGVEPEGETLADEAAWRKAMNDTLTATNALVTYTATMEERMGDYFFIDSGNATAKVADGKVYQTATYTSSFRYPDEETGDVLEGEEDFTNETYISIVDGVAIEWWRENAEEWNCSPYERYEYGFTPTLDGLLTYADINLSYFVESYAAFENVDGTYVFEMAEGGESGKLELKFVNGLLYSYVMESTYAYVEEGETFVESMSISSVITYGNATIGDLPPMTWDGEGGGDVGGDDKPSKTEIEGLEFTMNFDGDSYGVKVLETCRETELVLPSMYEGLPVTGVNDVDPDSGIEKIVLPSTITSIAYEAFRGCVNLQEITIPDSVSYIGGYAFSSCDNLKIVRIESIESWCGIMFDGEYYANPLSNPNASLYLQDELLTEIVIPGTVTSIRSYAFYNYRALTKVTISEGTEYIAAKAFLNCFNLAEVVIPDSVTSIGSSAFSLCDALTEIVIPKSVTYIGEKAFYYCDNLKIYCEAGINSNSWHNDWNKSKCSVVWGYTTEE